MGRLAEPNSKNSKNQKDEAEFSSAFLYTKRNKILNDHC